MLARSACVVVAAVAVTVFCTAGCGVHSVHPLSDPAAAPIDAELTGVWRLQLPDDGSDAEIFFHIGRSDSSASAEGQGCLHCQVIHHGDGGRMLPARSAALSTTVIGERKIANLRWESDAGKGRYTFAKYEVADDQLKLYTMRTTPVQDAIDKQSLQGTTIWSFPTTAVALSDSQDVLYKFVAATDDAELFGATTTLIFDRIKR